MIAPSSPVVRPQLLICVFVSSKSLARSLYEVLNGGRYAIAMPASDEEFFDLVVQEKQQLDCLVLQESDRLSPIVEWLNIQATLLPAVLLQSEEIQDAAFEAALRDPLQTTVAPRYHSAEVRVPLDAVDLMPEYIEAAIDRFLGLSPACRVPSSPQDADLTHDLTTQNFLMLQQRRLATKLKERLDYLGVYYKRNPRNFLRHLPPEERDAFGQELRQTYREIILSYFTEDPALNQKIDHFVNAAFFADLPISQIVETHMELMDEFSKQLKLEGRSEEVLLDYRLTLIDTLAHLCEMYRRSIPRDS